MRSKRWVSSCLTFESSFSWDRVWTRVTPPSRPSGDPVWSPPCRTSVISGRYRASLACNAQRSQGQHRIYLVKIATRTDPRKVGDESDTGSGWHGRQTSPDPHPGTAHQTT